MRCVQPAPSEHRIYQSDCFLSLFRLFPILLTIRCGVTCSAVDWSSVASNNYYAVPARQTKEVGRYTAELVDYLCLERGASTNSFHIVGHSLGELTLERTWSCDVRARCPFAFMHIPFFSHIYCRWKQIFVTTSCILAGAHTAGYTGAYTKSGKIPRITGNELISWHYMNSVEQSLVLLCCRLRNRTRSSSTTVRK